MATNYPGGLDSYTNPTSGNGLNSPAHHSQHTNVNDAVVAIENILGTNPDNGAGTVKARIAAIEASVAVLTNPFSILPLSFEGLSST